jgi:putative transposase
MSSWKPNFNPDYFYFVTTTAVSHLHVFERDINKRILLDTFDSFRLHKRLKLFCFVIMPNHTHFIGQFRKEDPLADVMRDFKRQTSDRILRQLKVEGAMSLLNALASKVTYPEKQHHKMWEDDYNAKDVFSIEFLQQKMDYIHHNPCRPHWNVSETPEEHIWSSARFYLTKELCIIPIDDVREYLV